MVICEQSNFMFIRIPKNASTSLASFFVKGYCDSNDKYTKIGDAGINNHNIPKTVLDKYKKGYRFIHLTLNEIINEDLISEESARSKRIIGCIREPFDRQLSLYFFLNRGKDKATPEHFRECFQSGYHATDENNKILQSDYLKIGDESVGEYWAYEYLSDHINTFIEENQPKSLVSLPKYKSHHRSILDKDKLLDEYYDQKTRDAVMKYYDKDFELYMETISNEKY